MINFLKKKWPPLLMTIVICIVFGLGGATKVNFYIVLVGFFINNIFTIINNYQKKHLDLLHFEIEGNYIGMIEELAIEINYPQWSEKNKKNVLLTIKELRDKHRLRLKEFCSGEK